MEQDFLQELKIRLRRFAAERDWDKFHCPKNLSMGLIAEAAEVVEHFQWLTEEQSARLPPEKIRELELELADVLIYVVRLADKLDIDLADATLRKISISEQKYPRDKVFGSSKKYTEY